MGSTKATPEDGSVVEKARDAQEAYIDIVAEVPVDGPFYAGAITLDQSQELIAAGDERVINYTVGLAEGYAHARDTVAQAVTVGISALELVRQLSEDALRFEALAERVRTGQEAEAISLAMGDGGAQAYEEFVQAHEDEFIKRKSLEAIEAIREALPEVGDSLDGIVELMSGKTPEGADEEGEGPKAA